MIQNLITLNDIDFLPAMYREEGKRRIAGLWWLLVIALYGGILVATGLYQRHLRAEAEAELARVEAEYASAVGQNKQLADLQLELMPLQSLAELHTFLQHPWPRTQLLNAVIEPLPKVVAIQQLHIGRHASSPQVYRNAATSDSAATADKSPPSARDLRRLRSETDPGELAITISGVTGNTSALHQYLSKLSQDDLFTKVELGSIEALNQPGPLASRFTARVVVRPGYGQPGGRAPVEAPATGSVASAQESTGTSQ